MYPLNDAQPYPFDHWWIAAYSDEVGRGIIARTILNQPVVLYRTQAGEAVALFGLCPHRLYPLVKGRLDGDRLECGYHGFSFDPSGRCVRVPSLDAVPPKFAVRRFPIIERGGLIWLWMGKELRADAASLPDLESMGLGTTGWGVEQHPRITIKARYQLLIENLLDLSHISFVHSKSIPGGGAVINLPSEIVESPRSLLVERVGRALPTNPHYRFLFPEYTGFVTQHFDTEFYGPSLIRTGGAMRACDAQGSDTFPLGVTNFLHGITPETPSSVHYFVMTARNFRLADPAIARANLTMGAAIQPEDAAVLESIETNADSFASTSTELSVPSDAGAIRARRRILALIRAEHAAI
jgi:nitrite reductase/ring-hydroxylating ferredoxin subunit